MDNSKKDDGRGREPVVLAGLARFFIPTNNEVRGEKRTKEKRTRGTKVARQPGWLMSCAVDGQTVYVEGRAIRIWWYQGTWLE